ncbi:MAG: hypothetical protein COW24_02645, partial [Candidatus Kerfeldbacteria bacterium CG15_BIG_FIL_POST_REV_8_21_14_020_45_12]
IEHTAVDALFQGHRPGAISHAEVQLGVDPVRLVAVLVRPGGLLLEAVRVRRPGDLGGAVTRLADEDEGGSRGLGIVLRHGDAVEGDAREGEEGQGLEAAVHLALRRIPRRVWLLECCAVAAKLLLVVDCLGTG